MTDLWSRVAEAGPTNGDGWNVGIGFTDGHERRDQFLKEFSFAVPSKSAIAVIKEFVWNRKLLEVGAGSGLWARLLTDAGVEVVAIDRKSRKEVQHSRWFPVQRSTAARGVRENRDCDALLLCWPDYDTRMAADALTEFRGDRLIYIGEGNGGCTGDDRFHKMLHENWKLSAEVNIPQWPGIHDDISLYVRRTA